MSLEFDHPQRSEPQRRGRAMSRQPGALAPGSAQARVMALQRAAGNRAVAAHMRTSHGVVARERLLQRLGEAQVLLPSMKKLTTLEGDELEDYQQWMTDFTHVQTCMLDGRYYVPALQALNLAVVQQRAKTSAADDDAAPLESVLLSKEHEYAINVRGAPVYTSVLSKDVFMAMNQQAVIANDPGAGFQHGAYTHRLQWWVIMYHADRDMFTHTPAELLAKANDPKYAPPRDNWPKEAPVKDIGMVPIAEMRGSLWVALFDRTLAQIFSTIYTVLELGISQPELFTAALLDGRIPGLEDVAKVIRPQVLQRYGRIQSETEEDLTTRGYTSTQAGVFMPPTG
jgi:hypothetical protein